MDIELIERLKEYMMQIEHKDTGGECFSDSEESESEDLDSS